MWQVFQKEFREILRDKKTLIFIIALPMLLFPAMFGGMGFVAAKMNQQEQERVVDYAIFGDEFAPELVAKFANGEKFNRIELQNQSEIEQAIRDEKISFALVIKEDFSANLANQQQVSLDIYLNDASAVSQTFNKVRNAVNEFNESRTRAQFSQLGFNEKQQEALITPVILNKKDVADKRENIGEKIGGIIPYMVIILLLQGAMSSAIDLGAGEKERGTLETLLITPIERTDIVLGKFITVCVAGIATAFITIFSFVLWGTILGQAAAIDFLIEFMGAITLIDFLLMFLMLVPIAAIVASTLLSMSIYARNFKEGQGYAGSLMFVFIIPIVFAFLPGVSLEGIWAWIPITNVSLAIKELVKGTMDYWMLLQIFSSTFIIAGALLAFCVYWFNQEKVLFR
jgi:sodium transport system permease protein